ncbi:hypothetical protein AB5J62_36685 [Amycolatopsis sp. cg5]|uniref:hypothetical protein n=1 Tax=Amycolatopsis sp. cg5 TaxID=3238802 RepID=UPI0035248CC7
MHRSDWNALADQWVRQAIGQLYMNEPGAADLVLGGNEDMHILGHGEVPETESAKCPDPGQHRAFAAVEDRRLDAVFIGRLGIAEKDNAPHQHLPNSARASVGDGSARHTEPFERCQANHDRLGQ